MSHMGDVLLYCIKFDYRLLLVTFHISDVATVAADRMLNNLGTLRVTSCRAIQPVEDLDYLVFTRLIFIHTLLLFA